MEPRVERPARARELLAQPGFLRLWMIGGLANAMRWLELLASALFAYQATGSGLAAAAVTAARTLPLLLFGALAGAVSEAVNRQHILVGGLIFTGLNALVVTGLAASGVVTVGLIAASSFLSGIVWASEMSTRRRMVGEAAGHDRIAQAIALDSVTNAVISDGTGFLTAKTIAGTISDALQTAAPVLSRGRLVSLRFQRATARRIDEGEVRRVDLTFRARIEL